MIMSNFYNALGLIEVIGYTAAVEAADSALKSANISLGAISKVGSGIVTVQIFGDVEAVKAGVEAASLNAAKIGELRSSHVIPRASNEVFENILKFKKIEVQKTEALENNNYVPENNNIEIEDINEEVFDNNKYSYEDLKIKSNNELKNIITEMGSDITEEKDYKYMKKEKLIQIILNLNKNNEGDSNEAE